MRAIRVQENRLRFGVLLICTSIKTVHRREPLHAHAESKPYPMIQRPLDQVGCCCPHITTAVVCTQVPCSQHCKIRPPKSFPRVTSPWLNIQEYGAVRLRNFGSPRIVTCPP